jgi:putative GTP pyrophosphokinase
VEEHSKTKIDGAGVLLRDWVTGRIHGNLEEPPMVEALERLLEYRQSFATPSRGVEVCLAALLAELTTEAKLTGRPKRTDAIVSKLVRHHGMRLTQMADIAGLRVRFPEKESEVEGLCRRIEAQWPTAKFIDYVAKPKPTGYRAVHVLIETEDRIVEVQLRTASQNRWADEVELAADRLSIGLKDGEGPEDLVRYFERAACKLAIEEQGGELDEAFKRDFEDLRRQVRRYFS